MPCIFVAGVFHLKNRKTIIAMSLILYILGRSCPDLACRLYKTGAGKENSFLELT